MDEKLKGAIYRLIQIHSPDTYECIEPTTKKIEQAFREAGWIEPQQLDKSIEKKIREVIKNAFASSCTREGCPVAEVNCAECAVKDVLVLLPSQQPEGRIAKMLQSGDRARLWYGRRFLDWDTISNEWVVMDRLGNKGLGDCLYSGANLDEALDALELKP